VPNRSKRRFRVRALGATLQLLAATEPCKHPLAPSKPTQSVNILPEVSFTNSYPSSHTHLATCGAKCTKWCPQAGRGQTGNPGPPRVPQGSRCFGTLAGTPLWTQWRILNTNYFDQRHPWAIVGATTCRLWCVGPSFAALGSHKTQLAPPGPEQTHSISHHAPRGQSHKQSLKPTHPPGNLWGQTQQTTGLQVWGQYIPLS